MKTLLVGIGKFKAAFCNSLQDFIFPKLCFHCSEKIVFEESRLLCQSCFDSLELIDPEACCPRCFSGDYQKNSFCVTCYKNRSFLTASASAFDAEGPAGTLINKLKAGDKPYLAESLASFMTMQLFKLDWPIPDCIVPVPLSKVRLFFRGYNQRLLLAEAMGRLINRPVLEAVGRKSGEYSQSALGYNQRVQLNKDSFFLRNGKALQDQKVLIVDDLLATGSTMRACAEIMIEGCPQQIYGLTACRSNIG